MTWVGRASLDNWLVTKQWRWVDGYIRRRYGPRLGPHPTIQFIYRMIQKEMLEVFRAETPEWHLFETRGAI